MLHGQKLVHRFATLNGVTVALLMNNMLILYAIRLGLGDAAVALLASFIFLTMPLMLAGKALTARIGAARTWGWGWILRNSSALVMILAPFVPADAPQIYRTLLVLAGALGFAAFRSIGLVGNSPLVGEITADYERGRFVSGNFTRTTITETICLLLVIIILRIQPATWVFQVLIGIGAGVGIYVGWLLTRVPESALPRRSARKALPEVLSRVWKTAQMRKTLFAWAASFAAFNLVIPFMLITVKNGYGLSDYEALILSMVTILGGVLASLVNGVIADKVGPRPLIIIYISMLAVLGAFWAFAPGELNLVFTVLAFFLGGYAKLGLLVTTSHYFLNTADHTDRVGASMVLRIVSGAVAGVVGGFIGGAILGALNSAGLEGMAIYRTYFRLTLVVLLAMVPVAWRLDRLAGEWSLRDSVGLLLRPDRIWRMKTRN
jgi:MFS family permease